MMIKFYVNIIKLSMKILCKYHQAKYEEDRGRIFIEEIDGNQTWIY